ncbi:MAG TPA: hypothetical protein VM487_25815 [Phycisphaerae bacterium]|nr:hypothetical protein [Phycisphaerae bacterium]
MPEPGGMSIHHDVALTDFSVAQFMDDDAYVARRAFPPVPVAKQVDKFFVYSKADLLRSDAQVRAPGTHVALRDWSVTDASYYIPVVGIGHSISEQDSANADAAINLEEDTVKVLVQDIKINEEVAFGAVAFAANWGTSATPSPTWENAAAYPLTDIATAIRTIQLNTGRRPNCLLLGAETWYSGLLNHPDIIERLPDNAPRIATGGFVADLLGLEDVFIAYAARNSSPEGATASYASILGDGALVFYRNPSPGRMSPSAGVHFVWSGLQGFQNGLRVQREFVPREDSMPLITVERASVAKVTSSDLGYRFSACIT